MGWRTEAPTLSRFKFRRHGNSIFLLETFQHPQYFQYNNDGEDRRCRTSVYRAYSPRSLVSQLIEISVSVTNHVALIG